MTFLISRTLRLGYQTFIRYRPSSRTLVRNHHYLTSPQGLTLVSKHLNGTSCAQKNCSALKPRIRVISGARQLSTEAKKPPSAGQNVGQAGLVAQNTASGRGQNQTVIVNPHVKTRNTTTLILSGLALTIILGGMGIVYCRYKTDNKICEVVNKHIATILGTEKKK